MFIEIIFQLTHGKQYESDIEEAFRLKIFMENKRRIAQHNAHYHKGKVSYKLAMNHFGDMVRILFTLSFSLVERFSSWLSDLCSEAYGTGKIIWKFIILKYFKPESLDSYVPFTLAIANFES